MTKVFKFAVWFVLFLLVIDMTLEMASSKNTIENIVGFIMLVIAVIITLQTKCLTSFNLTNKNNEK